MSVFVLLSTLKDRLVAATTPRQQARRAQCEQTQRTRLGNLADWRSSDPASRTPSP